METNEKKSVVKEKKTNNVIHIVSISLSAVAIVLFIVAICSNARLSRQCKMPSISRYQYAQYNQFGKNRSSRNGMHRSMMRNNGSNRNNIPMQQNKNNNNFGRNWQMNPNNNNFNWEQFGNFNRNNNNGQRFNRSNRNTTQDSQRNENKIENRDENNVENNAENKFSDMMP